MALIEQFNVLLGTSVSDAIEWGAEWSERDARVRRSID